MNSRHKILFCAALASGLILVQYAHGGYNWNFPAKDLNPGKPIRKIHIGDMRTFANQCRARWSLPPYAWQETIVSTTPVRASHIIELRTAIGKVYDLALQANPSISTPTWTNALTAKSQIKGIDFGELRNWIDQCPAQGSSPCGYPYIDGCFCKHPFIVRNCWYDDCFDRHICPLDTSGDCFGYCWDSANVWAQISQANWDRLQSAGTAFNVCIMGGRGRQCP